MTLLDQISDALGASGALGDLSSSLGASSADTDSVLSAGWPAIVGGLGAQTGGDGMAALMGLLKDDGGDLVDNLSSFFSQGDKTGLANKLVGSLFGSQRGAVESHIADSSGGAMSLVSRALPLLVPAVIGFISKMVKDDGIDAEGLGEQLAAVSGTGPLADTLSAGTEDDQAGFVQGITSLRDAGGLGALIPAAAPAAPVATTATATGGVAAGGAAAVHHLAGTDPDADEDRDRNGLGWIPSILLPLIVLIAGLVLWQCTGSDAEESAHNGDDKSEEPAGPASPGAEAEPEPEPEPTAVPAAASDPTPAPEPTPTPEPTAVPVVTIADLALANPELSTLVGLAADNDLVGLLSDADAGPFTVFAPTNDAFASANTLLGRLDDAQTGTTVTHHVVEGIVTAADLVPGATFQTVAGETLTVAEDSTLTGGVRVIDADITADNGVIHIVENVLVPGSVRRSIAAQDVNAAFELNPIQFASGSADILPESVPVLDEAIATLTSVSADSRFEVQGHTDTEGSDELNQTLSDDRAASVVAYLVDGGVDPAMLTARGYGETDLKIDPEVTPEDRAANRRIEFVVLTDA